VTVPLDSVTLIEWFFKSGSASSLALTFAATALALWTAATGLRAGAADAWVAVTRNRPAATTARTRDI